MSSLKSLILKEINKILSEQLAEPTDQKEIARRYKEYYAGQMSKPPGASPPPPAPKTVPATTKYVPGQVSGEEFPTSEPETGYVGQTEPEYQSYSPLDRLMATTPPPASPVATSPAVKRRTFDPRPNIVRKMQEKLRSLGATETVNGKEVPLRIDGKMGPGTLEAFRVALPGASPDLKKYKSVKNLKLISNLLDKKMATTLTRTLYKLCKQNPGQQCGSVPGATLNVPLEKTEEERIAYLRSFKPGGTAEDVAKEEEKGADYTDNVYVKESKNWIDRTREKTASSLFERLVKDASKKVI